MEDVLKFKVRYLDRKSQLVGPREITLPNRDSGITELKSKVSEAFLISLDKFDIFFGTRCLECPSERKLKDTGLASGMKLYAIQKKQLQSVTVPSPPDYKSVRNAMYGISTMFSDNRRSRQGNRTAVAKFIADKEAVNEIIDSVDGLKEDRVALDILESAKLIEVISAPKNVRQVIEDHPCLAHAFVAMWTSLMSSKKYSNFDPAPGTSYDSSESMDVDTSRPRATADAPPQLRPITSSQLAAALSAAASSVGDTSVVSDSTRTANGATSGSNQLGITPDAVEQALMATGYEQAAERASNVGAQALNPAVSEDTIKRGLEQLKAMGITDELVCRQALIATQGNVEAAINIIFGGSAGLD